MHALILAGVIAASSHHYPARHSTHAHHSVSHAHSATVHHSHAHNPITTTSVHRTHSVHLSTHHSHH